MLYFTSQNMQDGRVYIHVYNVCLALFLKTTPKAKTELWVSMQRRQ